MPSLQTEQTFGEMGVERNKDSRIERGDTIGKPQPMNAIPIADVDMEAVTMDGILRRQGSGLDGKAAVEARRRRLDDESCWKELREPDRFGIRGRPVWISRET
ncbi:hypothetical protein CN200_19630 [Sinorhizobium meliloti]|nr:hypothetical protein [Sinorhizobium meliloti]RVI14538.1 hypothetical protein CN200_19630 [Sinorhizobium meliloti]RVN81084.1 hypothetical protein CN107_27550 [Sinorhizobium meliloti]RVO03119.1 hypothetical protein CN103_25225 [Sinorhizobium meliloti]